MLLIAEVNYRHITCNNDKSTFFAFKEYFNISQVDVEGIVVENLARRCGGFLKSLSLNGCQVILCFIVIKSCRHVKFRCFLWIIKLVYFVILIMVPHQAVGDSALATFAQHCNNIERLNLRNCKKLSDRTCQYLARHCSKLQVIIL